MKLIDNFPILLFYGKLHVINGVRSETEEKLGEPYNPCRESHMKSFQYTNNKSLREGNVNLFVLFL